MAGYAEAVAAWFGQQAHVRFLPWEQWRSTMPEKDAKITWDHIARPPACNIGKAERLLDYRPRYRSLEAVRELAMWLVDHGVIEARISEATSGMK